MNLETVSTVLRFVLKWGGGYLVAKGFTDDSHLEAAIAAALSLVGFMWGIYAARAAAAAKTASPKARPPSGFFPMILSALLAGGLLCGALTACNSTPQVVTYQAAGTTITSVDAAMNCWGVYVAANHPGTNAEAQVKAAFEKYQASAALVCDAGAAYAASGGTNGIAAVNQAIANAGQNLADLQAVINIFTK